MPSRPLKPCTRQGCKLTVRKQGECPSECTNPKRFREDYRGNSAERGYGHKWRKLRRWILKREPLCRECKKNGRTELASDVDHIIPRSRGGTDDPDNLQPLCHPCHSRKTVSEDGGFGRGRGQVKSLELSAR